LYVFEPGGKEEWNNPDGVWISWIDPKRSANKS
jgi:hypothetical protein